MRGTTLGSYRIDAELGSGGMGSVYRATVLRPSGPLLPDTRVALKVIHPHLVARDEFLKRFLQEGRLGQRVRHVNVVSTYEAGTARMEGRRVLYLAMEYVEGRTLRQLSKDLLRVPETLLREIARQIAAGLAAIHEAGIVHRDMKPENVLVTRNHEVRIMDLGVARLIGDSQSLTQEGHFAGSLLYAAPEQFGRTEIGPGVDLYALGTMLYELSTGRHPFQHDDPGAVIRAHLEYRPPPITDHVADASPFFAELVDTLLAKEVSARFPSAAYVRDLFTTCERSAWWMRRRGEVHSRTLRRPRLPVPRDTALYGRGEELAVLRDAWARARRGEGNGVFLLGEAGIGKSRLLDAFIDEVARGDAHVLYGSYHPGGSMGGLSTSILAHLGEERLEAGLGRYLAQAPSLAPAFAAILRHEPPPQDAERVKGDALEALTVYLMRGLANEKPVFWVLDDLQFAGPDSRRVALAMARALAGHRVLLVVTSRLDFDETELGRFTALGNVVRMHLPRLSPREVIELLRDALQSEAVADRLGGQVAYKSDGVPLFVLEMVRTLKEARYLERRPDGSFTTTRVVESIEVPSAVRDLVETRLARLEPLERSILDVGAVQGYEFDAGLIAAVLGMKRIPVLQVLAQVARQSGIVRPAGPTMRFDHHQIQEVLYQALPDALRVEYHAALADAFAEAEGIEHAVGEQAVFLARHHLCGSRPHAALPYLQQALDHLESSYRNEALVDLVGSALGHAGLLDLGTQLELLLRQAERLGYLGSAEAEQAALDEALALCETEGARRWRAQVRARVGWGLVRRSRYAEAEEILADAVRLARETGDAGVESAATEHLGIVSYLQARYPEARAHFEQARMLASRAGDLRAEAQATGGMGVVLRAQGLRDLARACHERHLEMSREIGDRRGEMNALGNLANLLNYDRRYAEAQRVYEEALGVAREIGDRGGEATLQGSLAGLLWTEGHIEAARAKYESCLLLDRETGHRLGEARRLLSLGGVWRVLGVLDDAARHMESSLALSRNIGARLLEGHGLLGLAAVRMETEGFADARLLAEEAAELFRAIEQPSGLAMALEVTGTCLAEEGNVRRARAYLLDALDALDGRPDAGGWPEGALLRCRLAVLPGGDAAAAREAYERGAEHAGALVRLEMRHLLWRATREPAWLEAAWSLLSELRRRAPVAWRDSMLERVRLHRAIREDHAALPPSPAARP